MPRCRSVPNTATAASSQVIVAGHRQTSVPCPALRRREHQSRKNETSQHRVRVAAMLEQIAEFVPHKAPVGQDQVDVREIAAHCRQSDQHSPPGFGAEAALARRRQARDGFAGDHADQGVSEVVHSGKMLTRRRSRGRIFGCLSGSCQVSRSSCAPPRLIAGLYQQVRAGWPNERF